MEAIANIHGFELFDNKDGRFYRPVAKDDAPLRRYLDRWDWQPIEERYQYILKVREGDPLEPAAVARMSELRALRHLLAHGHDAPGLIMIDGGDRTAFEIEVPRDRNFLKFSDFHKLNHDDARKALEVVLPAAQHLASSFGFLLPFVSYEIDKGGVSKSLGTPRVEAVDELLSRNRLSVVRNSSRNADSSSP